MTAISRRALLAFGGGAAAAIPLGLTGRAIATSSEATIARFIRAQLPGMQIADEKLREFASRFLEASRGFKGYKLTGALLILDNPWMQSLMPLGVRSKFERFARGLLTDFLFSTDFFTSANRRLADTTYIEFSDPYSLGCRNPLATFDLET